MFIHILDYLTFLESQYTTKMYTKPNTVQTLTGNQSSKQFRIGQYTTTAILANINSRESCRPEFKKL